MSTTTPFTSTGSKRPLSDSNPTTTNNGGYKKPRRKRTSRSCTNCHTFKRMCDRKRPCERCTKYGLTALCVYQVDESNPDSENETSHLRNRIIELETMIAENQPLQRRRVQNGRKGATSNSSDATSLTPRSASASSPQSSPPALDGYIDMPSYTPHGFAERDLGALSNPPLQQDFPKSDGLKQFIASDETLDWLSLDRAGLGHCGCANETNSYVVLLELSLRLRKASEIVGHHSNHPSGSTCVLNHKIAELDDFVSRVLPACNPPPKFYPTTVSPHQHQVLPHASVSASHLVSHLVAHLPVSGTAMPITPTNSNYPQPSMRPTITPTGHFAMQSQLSTGPTVPHPVCDEPMSQLVQAEWHHPVQGQVYPMQVSR